MKSHILTATACSVLVLTGSALAAHHAMSLSVKGSDQDVSSGTVTASEVTAGTNGWLVVHRTDGRKPGPVVGHAPLRKGMNKDVAAILTEPVKRGEKLMLMVHGEAGGNKTGIFEYTLGAKEDGPVRVDGKLVMVVVTAR